jgi:hypothetical protein
MDMEVDAVTFGWPGLGVKDTSPFLWSGRPRLTSAPTLVHPVEVNNPTAVNINAKYFIGSPLSGTFPDDLSLTTTASSLCDLT